MAQTEFYLTLQDGNGFLLEQDGNLLLHQASYDGTLIQNTDATTNAPNSFEVCQLSGFKFKRGTLIKDGYGRFVHPDRYEGKHPSDFGPRGVDENLRGSIRPEGQDIFLSTNEVTVEDL
jgi:hypothetical protein